LKSIFNTYTRRLEPDRLTRDILSQLVAWRLMLVAQFLKELPAAGQVRRRQAAMVPDEIMC